MRRIDTRQLANIRKQYQERVEKYHDYAMKTDAALVLKLLDEIYYLASTKADLEAALAEATIKGPVKKKGDTYPHYPYKPCPVCSRAIQNAGFAWVSHMRAHVRRGQLLEYLENGYIAFKEVDGALGNPGTASPRA